MSDDIESGDMICIIFVSLTYLKEAELLNMLVCSSLHLFSCALLRDLCSVNKYLYDIIGSGFKIPKAVKKSSYNDNAVTIAIKSRGTAIIIAE